MARKTGNRFSGKMMLQEAHSWAKEKSGASHLLEGGANNNSNDGGNKKKQGR
jgi:hypothetical protein